MTSSEHSEHYVATSAGLVPFDDFIDLHARLATGLRAVGFHGAELDHAIVGAYRAVLALRADAEAEKARPPLRLV